eukprot:TRINITY_DN21914_c0_g1_i1.p1 TRINITY_DN21914_c0_g1~~TRINITY_DN21914_c0_g1_i1.p1  ORF type:complete len:134 (+),score=21.53 TRINITY_DN21914_c0_g1_i1:108-509(+)
MAMLPATVITYDMLTRIADQNPQLKITVDESVKASLMVGGVTLVGSLLLGPVGIIAGAAIGGSVAYATSKPFTSAFVLLSKLDEQQREQLLATVQDLALQKEVLITDQLLLDLLIAGINKLGFKAELPKIGTK